MAAGKGYDHVVSIGLEYPRGGIQMMVQDPEDNKIWHDQLANSSLPYRRYAAIVLLEEKIVTKSLINLQGMWVKEFIYIALASK